MWGRQTPTHSVPKLLTAPAAAQERFRRSPVQTANIRTLDAGVGVSIAIARFLMSKKFNILNADSSAGKKRKDSVQSVQSPSLFSAY